MGKNDKKQSFSGNQAVASVIIPEDLPLHNELKSVDNELPKLRGAMLSDEELQLISDFRSLPKQEQTLSRAFIEALKVPGLPESTDDYYAKRKVCDELGRKENPVEFIQRVYAQYMETGLPRAQIKKLDPKLYQALANWLGENDLPKGVMLPKQAASYDRISEKLFEADPKAAEVATKLHSLAQGLQARLTK